MLISSYQTCRYVVDHGLLSLPDQKVQVKREGREAAWETSNATDFSFSSFDMARNTATLVFEEHLS